MEILITGFFFGVCLMLYMIGKMTFNPGIPEDEMDEDELALKNAGFFKKLGVFIGRVIMYFITLGVGFFIVYAIILNAIENQ